MYLHLGQDTVVKLSEVVAIFDLENASIAKATKRYLDVYKRQGIGRAGRIKPAAGRL